jgi:cytochrome c551/c552
MKTKYLVFTIALFMSIAAVAAPPVEEGKSIFTARCAFCHSIDKTLTGPALAGVDQRRSIDWIVSFVKSSQTLVKSGDKDAVAIFEKFNKIPMPDHPDLTDGNIKSIVEYIKSQGSATASAAAPFAKPAKIHPNYTPLSINNYGFFLGYLGVVAILIVALLFAVQFKQYERKLRGNE